MYVRVSRKKGRLTFRETKMWGLTVFRSRADEANWSWDYAADQQLVVEDCGSSFLVWIYLHVLFMEAFSAVVGALT